MTVKSNIISILSVLFSLASCGSSVSSLTCYKRYPTELPQTGMIPLHTLRQILDPFFRAPEKPLFTLRAYRHNLSSSPTSIAYIGGSFDPINNEIIFIPFAQSSQATWHKYNCRTKTVISYQHGMTGIVGAAYRGGVFDPINKQIVFVPSHQQTSWHRYDCLTQTVIAYTAGTPLATSNAYQGGVFDPVNCKIIFVPLSQTSQSIWHRYNCIFQSIENYAGIVTTIQYQGGVLDPIHHKIIFIPHLNSHLSTWHRYNCLEETAESYNHNHTVVNQAYTGGVLDPIHLQIIFIPYGQANQTVWHKYDCLSQSVLSYTHQLVTLPSHSGAYASGVFDPLSLKIFFIPFSQMNDKEDLHYYDCLSQNIISYSHTFHQNPSSTIPADQRISSNGAYHAGVFDPINNEIIFTPHQQASQNFWHNIRILSDEQVSISLLSHALFNKF